MSPQHIVLLVLLHLRVVVVDVDETSVETLTAAQYSSKIQHNNGTSKMVMIIRDAKIT